MSTGSFNEHQVHLRNLRFCERPPRPSQSCDCRRWDRTSGLDGSNQPISHVLQELVGRGNGLELVSEINDIPKGSRLAVSTNLLGSLISVLMRATSQISQLAGPLDERDRKLVGSRYSG